MVLSYECKPRESSDYDKIVCAENPDPKSQPILYSIAKRCMIHGPCGISKKVHHVRRNDSCTKKFPKLFSNFTTITKDG